MRSLRIKLKQISTAGWGGGRTFPPQYKVLRLKRKCEQWKSVKPIYMLYWILYRRKEIKFGIDLPAATVIGKGFKIEHTFGIVVNPEAVIGTNCNIYNGVTIGKEKRGRREGNPTIGDCVWIGANSVIVGKIHIGNDVLIAPNSFVNFDVPDHSIVIGNPASVIHKENATEEYIKYIT